MEGIHRLYSQYIRHCRIPSSNKFAGSGMPFLISFVRRIHRETNENTDIFIFLVGTIQNHKYLQS